MRLHTFAVASAVVLAGAPASIYAQTATQPALHERPSTAVYVATNAAAGNAVVAYRVAAGGGLTTLGAYPTGGAGSGPNKVPTLTPAPIDPLVSNDSIRYDAEAHVLLAVNAGSASVTSFAVNADDTLALRSVVASGGLFPTSIAAHGNLVYVANVGNPAAGVPATVSGFALAANGKLAPIPGSTRTLSQPDGSQAATIVFSPDGGVLVAADTGGDRITTYAVHGDGRLGNPVSTVSAGAGPFGAIFHGGALLVSETQDGIPGATSLTSYRLLADGHVVPISASVPSGETAGCWAASRASTPLVFVADTGSGTISSFEQAPNGTLRLVIPAAAPVVAGSGPIDLALSRDAAFVFQLYGGVGKIGVYRIAPNGSLSLVGGAVNLPATGAEGLAVN